MILVTGGTGLVGAHLLLHLIESRSIGRENVRAIYRNRESIKKTQNLFDLYEKSNLFESIDWVQADITDIPSLEKAFTGIDQVYHCAALISFDPKDEDLIRKTNIEGTANIVNFCVSNAIQKLCFMSSIAALGDLAPHESQITEETEWNPEKYHSDYAISKYGAEMEVWRGQQEGLKVIIINPGVIIAPVPKFWDWQQGSGIIFAKVKKGLSFYTLGSSGFIAVTDVVRIATELMKSEIHDERFTLIAENLIFQDFLYSIADSLKVKRPSTHASPLFMEIVWRMDWLLSTIFKKKRKMNKATAIASYSKNKYSNKKIKSVLNTNFLAIHQYIKAIANL